MRAHTLCVRSGITRLPGRRGSEYNSHKPSASVLGRSPCQVRSYARPVPRQPRPFLSNAHCLCVFASSTNLRHNFRVRRESEVRRSAMSLEAMTMRAVYSRVVDSPFLQFGHASPPPRPLLPTSPFVLPKDHWSTLLNPCFSRNIRRTNLRRVTRVSSSHRSVGPLKAAMASTPSTETETQTRPFSVLFVCLGNICRSPAAEAVFREIVKRRGLESKFKIDSAGTIDYHEGNQADPRMRAASKQRGVEVTSISRPIRPSDFRDFDLILAMDKQNRDDIFEAFNRWRFKETLPFEAHKKVRLMCSYCKKHDETEVPDPYYGGPQGFEEVLDLLEDACESLLDNILNENSHILDS